MRNCSRPLRHPRSTDTRDDTGTRCPVEGWYDDSLPAPPWDATTIRTVWDLLDLQEWVDRESPSAIPADVWEGLTVLRYYRRSAAERWAELAERHAAATRERR